MLYTIEWMNESEALDFAVEKLNDLELARFKVSSSKRNLAYVIRVSEARMAEAGLGNESDDDVVAWGAAVRLGEIRKVFGPNLLRRAKARYNRELKEAMA